MIKLSVIIVTYNNEGSIVSCIESVKESIDKDSEIIIVDNNSSDETLKILRKYQTLKIIESDKNLGYAKGCNLAAKEAKGQYLFFLNPDTKTFKDSIKKLLEFISSNENIGIVAPKLFKPSGAIQESARSDPSIKGAIKEFFLKIKNSYSAYTPKGDSPAVVETVVGAAFLIKKEIFEKVGGFNEKYFMYYEDLDLCRKIRELGLKIIYLPEAKFEHQVGGSMSDQKSSWLKQSAKIYHGDINYVFLQSILKLRPTLIKTLLVLIIILAFGLRFYKVAENPPSLNWDEVSIGYNAYSILKTGKDEWNKPFPIHFKSYGEYKLPIQIYGSIPSIAIFGLNEYGVRITPVIYGTLTILFLFFLTKALFKNAYVGLTAAFFLAVSPWHIQLTRGSFESSFSVFWIVLGIWLLLKGFEDKKWFIISMIPFAISVFTYNSARIFTPIFLFSILIIYRKKLFKYKKAVLVSIIFFLGLTIPLAPYLLSGERSARYKLVSVTDDPGLIPRINENRGLSKLPKPLPRVIHNKVTYISFYLTRNYLSHFNPNFLFISGAPHKQHHVQGVGQLYLFQAPLVLAGLYFLIKNKFSLNGLIFSWLLIAFIPVSVTNDSIPHALRTLIAAPVYQIIAAIGAYKIYIWLKNKKQWLVILTLISIIVVSFSLFSYLNNYFNSYPKLYSRDWQYGNKEVVEYIRENQNKYDEIVFSRHYGEPHMFTLFYLNYDPAKYQNNPNLIRFETYDWVRVLRFDKYYFPDLGDDGTRYKDIILQNKGKRLLFIGKEGDFPEDLPMLKTVNFLNGNMAFEIVESK